MSIPTRPSGGWVSRIVYEARMFWYDISAQEIRDIMACSSELDARVNTQYDKWFDEVLRIAALMGWTPTAIASIDKQAWKIYFDEKHTPAQAWHEEYDCANR